MHLGYHELRNMLQKFREEREAKKNLAPAPPSSAPTAPATQGAPKGGRDDRDRDRDGGRDRDRGYDRDRDRHSSGRYDRDRE